MAQSTIDTCVLHVPDSPPAQFPQSSLQRKRTLEPNQGSPRPLACPFYKFLPPSHPAVSSRACSSGWTSISRLKEHLYRAHSTDKLPCLRCYKLFKSSDDLQRHQQAGDTCCILPQPAETRYIIFPDKKARLKNRKKGVTNEEAWSSIWTTIFPGVPEPPDPYFSPPMERALEPLASQRAASLQRYLRELPSLVAADLVKNSSLNLAPERENDVMVTVQSRLDKMLSEWAHQTLGVSDELREDSIVTTHDGCRVPTMQGLDNSAVNARSLLKHRQEYDPFYGATAGVGDWTLSQSHPQPLFISDLEISSTNGLALGSWNFPYDEVERSPPPLIDEQPLAPTAASLPPSFPVLERPIAFHSSPRNERANIRNKRLRQEEDNGIRSASPYIGDPDPL